MKNKMMKCENRVIVAMAVVVMCLGAFAEASSLLPPEIGVGWENGWVKEWRKEIPGLEVSDRVSSASGNFTRIVRSWTWRGKEPLEKVTLSVRLRVKGDTKALKPFIPGILIYGNPSNFKSKGTDVPVYEGLAGEFAIFEENRLPMPFVLLENSATRDFVALHTLPTAIPGPVKSDLWWSAGVEATSDGADIVLLSGPIGFNHCRSTAKGRPFGGGGLKYDEAYITLKPGKTVEKTFFIHTGRATDDNFGFQQAMRKSLELFSPECALPREAHLDDIFPVKLDYARKRWCEDTATGMCGFEFWGGCCGLKWYSFGWCGGADVCSYVFAVAGKEPGDVDKAQRSLDALSEKLGGGIREDGIFPIEYVVGQGLRKDRNGKDRKGDAIHCGMTLDSVMRAIVYARKHPERGLKPEKWVTFAKKSLGNVADHVLAPTWKGPDRSGETYYMVSLVMGSEAFGEPKLFAAAEKMADKIAETYIGYDRTYWGGALDSACEDKEGAMAPFLGFEALLRHAVKVGDKIAEAKYARLARHALDFMLTFLQVWDVTMPPGSDLNLQGFRSTGWTVVSPQNQCLDAFVVYATPAIWRYGDYLKDERLKAIAKLMYSSAFQLTDAEGSAGEQIQQTNYGHLLSDGGPNFPGPDSDASSFRGIYRRKWTVLWLTSHFLGAGVEFAEMNVNW